MGGYKTHIGAYVGFIFFLLGVLYYFFGFMPLPETLLVGFVVGLLYSVFPDIDARKSKIRGLFVLAFLFFFVFFLFYSDIVFGVVAGVLGFFLAASMWSGHRGFFHTLSAAVLFSVPLYFVDPYFFLFAFMGFLTHLAVDGKLFSFF